MAELLLEAEAPPLVWRAFRSRHPGACAKIGADGQGDASVVRCQGAWIAVVDMLPDDLEGAIYIRAETEDAAKRAAERQVAVWPTLLPGAHRP